MFWLLLASTLGICFYFEFMVESKWTITRTITWGWDPKILLWEYTPSLYTSLIIFNIGYGIMYWLKRKVNFTMSMLQLALIVLLIFSGIGFYSFSLLSWMVFLLNLGYSRR